MRADSAATSTAGKTVLYTITFEGGRWRARSPEVIGAASATSLASLVRQLEEAAAFTHADFDGQQVVLAYSYHLPDEAADALTVYQREVEAESEHARLRLEAAKVAAQKLTEAGISERDAGRIMGLTGARVHQLKQSA